MGGVKVEHSWWSSSFITDRCKISVAQSSLENGEHRTLGKNYR